MNSCHVRGHVLSGLILISCASLALAQAATGKTNPARPMAINHSATAEQSVQPMSLDQRSPDFGSPVLNLGETSPGVSAHLPPYTDEPFDNLYREVSDFFNIREANPNTVKGEWEVEAQMNWETRSNGFDDLFYMEQSVRYGVTNDFFVELSVLEPNLGDGGDQGNGDLGLTLFYRCLKEVPGEDTPSIGSYLTARFPTGDGSRNTDVTAGTIITKSLGGNWRTHFQGYVRSANGGSSDWVDEGRRDVQWGFGPGFDYEIDEKTLLLFNYLNKSSDKFGQHNNNILELGASHQIAQSEKCNQHIKAAVDIGLDGQDETPNVGAKFLWVISWQ